MRRTGPAACLAGSAVLLTALAACASGPTSVPATATAAPTGGAEPARVLPDHALTPGASVSTDPAVVCAPGYSRSVRPPSQYTDALKDRQLAAGYPGTTGLSSRDVEEDHLSMLALGGDPRNPQNLWPEPRHVRAADGQDAGADTKDLFESYLYTQVCRQHALTVPQAQQQLTTDWYAAYVAAGRPHGSGTSS